MGPCQSVNERCLYYYLVCCSRQIFCSLLFLGCLGLEVSQIASEKKTPFFNGSIGAHRTRVQFFRAYPQNNGVKSALCDGVCC